MVRRISVAALWFISAWMGYQLVAYFLGLPYSGGAVVGALVAALVFLDPTGQLRTSPDRSDIETTPQQATEPSESVGASAR